MGTIFEVAWPLLESIAPLIKGTPYILTLIPSLFLTHTPNVEAPVKLFST